jgi:excisionase family DNA binding protein
MQQQEQEKVTMTVQEFGGLYGIPVSTVRHWIQTGQGPKSSKIGKQRLFLKSEVAAWAVKAFEMAA